MKNWTETELKLTAPDGAALEAVGRDPLLTAAAEGEAETVEMRSSYYDLPDGSLRAAKLSLRFRTENGRGVVTVKRGVKKDKKTGKASRTEWEVEADSLADGLERLGAIPELAGLLPPAEALAETARVVFTRVERRTRFAGAEIALCLDRGWFESPEHPFFEAEAELAGGEQTALGELSAYLCGKYALTPEPRSKASRAAKLRARK
jgi:inorganic triphosphatase YgiF